MTRKTRREIARDLDDLDDDNTGDDTLRVEIRRDAVDEHGEVVERNGWVVEI
ncbi:hypothetical protein [Haloarcula laminariae]|uniref:hypothetical protein n=1 Tax=Haloarcula laminariae TaxID=2961577 RepID=UPI0021C6025E|nr:hypothetical protein [Halomicroarcula laminariae]